MNRRENPENQSLAENLSLDDLQEMDWSIINQMPWAKELWKTLEGRIKNGFLYWAKIVNNVAGEKDTETIKNWSNTYKLNFDDFLMDMVTEASNLEQSTIEKIKNLLIQLQTLCDELQEPIPQIGDGSLSLYEEQAKLMDCLKQYEDIINQKKKELKTLQDKQRRLCKQLGEEPKVHFQQSPLPTQAQLAEYQHYVEKLENERFERDEKYCKLQQEILELVEVLKYKPKDDFEKKVITSDEAHIDKHSLERLEFLANSLKATMKQTKEDISQLRQRIEDLWKMLDINLMDRDEFRSHFTGNSLETLDALWIEVKRCEKIRKANIQMFVEKLRVELQNIWQKCHCTDLEKRKFKYFHTDCFTEDLLDLHELEIQKWKTFYEKNATLLELINKHQDLWQKALQLEENATGPDRYKNRGGKLLLEEKERNKLSKQIPKIEEEIVSLSEEFRQKHGYDFTTFGRTPEEYIGHLHSERENNRQLKLSARKLQRENTTALTPAKSAINLFPSTSRAVTPSTPLAPKRKILATPSTDNKRLRTRTPMGSSRGVPMVPRSVPKIKITHAPATLPSQKRKSRSSMDNSRRRRSNAKSKKGRKEADGDVNNTTYAEFETDLSSKENVRSTILPDDIPIKTPSKPSTVKKTRPVAGTPYAKTRLRTPITPKSPTNPGGKLTACKSSLKLLF